ncbi:hypothetical protein M3936_09910 [Sutcliffiella horikoshii]|uniref:hypothetical protein n=1 Tax=Sutcliffiella horikoshii TaxID=79883 RepID=UPI00203CD075|nr:hypothetical protein [Sutcliffiella horikoshii]MCM3617894.1 hypothetical protein [Sutcliffiella horikoshii]
MIKDDSIFHYIKQKYLKSLRKLAVLNFLLIIIMIFSFFTVFISAENIHNNILNNDKLSMVLVNGYSGAGEFEYDTDKISSLPNVKNLTYEYEIPLIYSSEEEEVEFINCLPLNETTRDAISFQESVSSNALVLPEPFTNKVLTVSDLNNNPLQVDKYYYEGTGTYFLKEKCYLAEPLFEDLTESITSGENYSSVKSLLVNLEKTEYIYDFVQSFHDMFDEDEVYVYYQAEGLESLVQNSKVSFYLLLFFQLGLIIVIVLIYRNSLHSLIKLINRDLLSLYINGMSSKQIAIQFYKTIESQNKKVYLSAFGAVILFALFISRITSNETLIFLTLGLLASLALLVFMNKLFVKSLISKLLSKELSNENIVSKLRN